MLYSSKIERGILLDVMKHLGRRPSTDEVRTHCLDLLRRQQASNGSGHLSRIIVRAGIKAGPDLPDVPQAMDLHQDLTRQHVRSDMPQLAERVALCNDKELPVPLVVSCKKYLAKARRVADELASHYFDIEPIVVVGDMDGGIETFDDGVLRLPVNDDYEGLPHKVLELYVLFEALGARHGVIKIDDDVTIDTRSPLALDAVRAVFRSSTYAGTVMSYPHLDRTWHFGKCASPVAAFYGKPFVAPYAHGPLYFLSQPALQTLASHYLRYPGCLDGELYEDKAVGDILHSHGIGAEHRPLQPILRIKTDAPDRLLETALL